MNGPAPRVQKARIGPFEANFDLGELRKHGTRLKIHEQPLKILALLVARPGELVTREEIRQSLWPSGTFVDFDNGLNSAINRLRAVLGDSAESPRFIETVPRRGYRLIAKAQDVQAATLPVQEAPRSGDSTRVGWRGGRRLLYAAVISATAVLAVIVFALRRVERHAVASHEMHAAAVPIRIAVLPFTNLTGDPQQEYLADGMTEEMIAVLGGLSPGRLDVIARTSAMHYKNTVETIPQIGRELNVDYLLESSMQSTAGGERITARLIRASDASQVWVGEFDVKPDAPASSQQQAAAGIADSIKLTLSPATDARSPSMRTSNPEAYRSYLLGRYYWNKRDRESLERARTYFERAIDRDPSYARAYAGLADDYLVLGGGFMPAEQSYAKAKAMARRAMELDDHLPEPYASLAYEEFIQEWDWQQAEADFRRSLALDPNYATAHEWYAIFLAAMRRNDEAVKEIDRALELDPLSLAVNYNAASIYLQAGRNAEAFELARKSLDIDPDSTTAHLTLAAVYEKTGRYSDAISEFQTANRGAGEHHRDSLMAAHSYILAGNRTKALAILQDWLPSADRPLGSAYGVAFVYTALGDKDQAFRWLRKAVAQRSCTASEINTDWRLDALRADAQFAQIRAQFGFPN